MSFLWYHCPVFIFLCEITPGLTACVLHALIPYALEARDSSSLYCFCPSARTVLHITELAKVSLSGTQALHIAALCPLPFVPYMYSLALGWNLEHRATGYVHHVNNDFSIGDGLGFQAWKSLLLVPAAHGICAALIGVDELRHALFACFLTTSPSQCIFFFSPHPLSFSFDFFFLREIETFWLILSCAKAKGGRRWELRGEGQGQKLVTAPHHHFDSSQWQIWFIYFG